MTGDRKQELRRLLEEAMGSMEIRRSKSGVSMPSIDVGTYRTLLQQRWVTHSANSPLVWQDIEPEIVNETTKLNLLDFLRAEFAAFIHQDRIQSVCSLVSSSPGDGYPLSALLKQLLRIAIGRGLDKAVANFDKYTHESVVSVKYMGILEGIRLKTKISVFDGIKLVALPKSTSDLPNDLPTISASGIGISPVFFMGKTLLIIDYFLSPVFHTPLKESIRRAHFEQTQRTFRRLEYFCQALSLACNSAVQISLKWPFWPEDELLYLARIGPGPPQISAPPGLFSHSMQVDQPHIAEANRLCQILDKNPKIRTRLRIPINRWIKSKTREEPIDKIIDLGIALEALYVTRDDRIQKQLCYRASWYLGENSTHQEDLERDLEAIYEFRSAVVHNRRPGNEVTIGTKTYSVADLVKKTQCLCRASILKFIKAGGFPDWSNVRQAAKDKWVSS